MLVVETISKIRRWYFQEGRPIKRICRDLGVSRKTVRKVIRSGAAEFSYERSVQPQPKLGPWREELDRMLAENVRRPKRERLTRIRIFEDPPRRRYCPRLYPRWGPRALLQRGRPRQQAGHRGP
jgi:hypothetical protein